MFDFGITAWYMSVLDESILLFIWYVVLTFFSAVILWGLFWFSLRLWMAIKQQRNHVYMKILLPRGDSKKDKEDQNEKDFKEKVAIMESFYRAVSEIQELNFWNTLRNKIFNADFVSLELVYQEGKLNFYLATHNRYAELIEKQITSNYTAADVEYSDKPFYDVAPKGQKLKAYYMYLKQLTYYPIRTYKNMGSDPLNGLTNVLSKLQHLDNAVVQVVIDPLNKNWQKEAGYIADRLYKGKKIGQFGYKMGNLPLIGLFFKVIGGIFGLLVKGEAPQFAGDENVGMVRMLSSTEETLKRMGEKSASSGFDTTIRILASSDTATSAQKILDNLVLAFNAFTDQGSNWFQNRRIVPIDSWNNKLMLFNFNHRLKAVTEKSSILVPEELTSIYHFPTSRYNLSPVINWLPYKVLPPPDDMTAEIKEGVVFGNNVYRGKTTPCIIKPDDRTRHMYVIGKSGSGKSVLINYMARQDFANGDGACVVDPHGDLIEDCLKYIPKERAKDVIVFNPSDTERPMGLNMLQATTPAEMDMASLQATEIFIKLFGDEIFGPRIQHYFRNGCLTLMEDQEEGATLIDVPRLFVDEEFLKYKTSKLKNPVVKSFWEHEYANTGDREKQEMIPYFSSKFGPFITNVIMRNTIGQPKSSFNFRKCMDEQKILLINLSKGKVGDLNTELLGLVCVAQIQMAAMSRVDTAEKDRKPFYLYVDEFQNFVTDSFASILSEARKYKLGLIMAHQYIGQLTVTKGGGQNTAVRDAVFGNAGTLLSFKVGADDGEFLAKEFAPVLSEQDIIGIAKYKAYCKLAIDSSPSRPFSVETIWDVSTASEKTAQIIKEYSRLKYGRKKIFVDQEVEARIGIT
jgi:hypothetical protein